MAERGAIVVVELDLPGRGPFWPGCTFECTIRVTAKTSIEIIDSKLIFLSRGWCEGMAEPEVYAEFTSFIPLIPSNPQHQPSSSQSGPSSGVMLLHGGQVSGAPSSYEGKVTVVVPSDIPDTWSYGGLLISGYVRNTLKAAVTCARLDRGQPDLPLSAWTEEDIWVKIYPAIVDEVLTHDSATASVEVSLSPPGVIRCTMTVLDTLGRLGKSMPITVDILNTTSMALHKVSLALYKEYTFKPISNGVWGPTTTVQECCFEQPLTKIQPLSHWRREILGFIVPPDCLTNHSLISCSFINVRFFVMLRVECPCTAMVCENVVFLGTHANHNTPPPRLGLDMYDITSHADLIALP